MNLYIPENSAPACIPLTRREAICATLFPGVAFGSVMETRQRGWRFCTQCYLMFRGPNRAGKCPGGGQHQPAGYQFAVHTQLTEGLQSEPAPPQDKWRQCRHCFSLFYNGYQQKGKCPANGLHNMDPASKLLLSHDRMPNRYEQADWRFCRKCFGLFFDGYPKKGLCAAGGEHEKAGYTFVIPYI